MMIIIKIILGGMLLLSGRRLFWLLVGGIGFLAGSYLASILFQGASEWVLLTIALVIGVIGAVLAQFLQKVGVGLAGFILGGMALSGLVASMLGGSGLPEWATFLIGGGMGILLTIILFDWSLIILSSLAGAWMIISVVSLPFPIMALIFLVLFFVGLTLQFRLKSKEG
jgi:hypothetical protein